MISNTEALKIVLNTSLPFKTEEVVLEHALDRVLAEDLVADRPFPPFDRVTMDGIAINFIEFESGKRQFEILGIDRVLVEEATGKVSRFRINDKEIYARVIIRNRKI